MAELIDNDNLKLSIDFSFKKPLNSKYNLDLLNEYCKKFEVFLKNDYSNIELSGKTRIIGQCVSCNNNFDKNFISLIQTSPFCRPCTYLRAKHKRKTTLIKRYNIESPLQLEEFKQKQQETNLKIYGHRLATQSDQVKNKTRLTNETKYPEGWCSRTQENKDKIEHTNLIKFGCKNPMQNELIKEKLKNVFIDKYNVTSPAQNPEFNRKMKNTNKIKFGFENVFQNEQIKEKSKETSLKKYGTKFPMQNIEVKQKMEDTCLKKYGYKNVMHNPEIAEKAHSKFGLKEYIFPSGRTEFVQGYESLVLDILIYKKNIDEDDIFVNKNEVPEVWYNFEGKERRYYTDIYIQTQKKCIEVKSDYYFNLQKEKNLLKQQAVKDLGMKCEIWIFNRYEKLDKILY